MTIITPLLYDALVADGRPPLAPGPVAGLRERVGDLGWIAYEARIERLVDAVPFRMALAEGAVGVPLLDGEELAAFLGDAAPGESAPPPAQRWWELWPTADGLRWALFPAATGPSPRVWVTLPVPGRGATELRVLDAGVAVGEDGGLAAGPPATPRERCVVVGEDIPGMPFRGSCREIDCGAGCTPLVYLVRGVHELHGCACP